MFDQCLFLTGPTASGKTELGIELARQLDAEILSLDSMAVYRGMEVGTAKPTATQRAEVPHHLIDLVDPSDDFSVADYLAAARRVTDEIALRGRRGLFVGGTPLYLKALLRGFFAGPPANWPLRHQLAEFAQLHGTPALHDRLRQVDPQAAEKLHANDLRRVIRALEVFAVTGEPISRWQRQFDDVPATGAPAVFALEWPRDELYRRIDSRVERMFAQGLIDEVRALLERGVDFGRTAAQAVGYREVLEHLRGVRDRAATIERVQTRTRQFAKRQLTWFRSLAECQFVAVDASSNPRQVASSIFSRIRVG